MIEGVNTNNTLISGDQSRLGMVLCRISGAPRREISEKNLGFAR